MDQKDYEFMKEKIKDKPFRPAHLGIRILLAALIAVVFGVVACFTFFAVKPSVEKLFLKDKDEAVTIPKDELDGDTAVSGDNTGETEADEKEDEPETVYITEKQELQMADYQALSYQFYAIGREANRSVVTVTGVSSGTDWFNDSYERHGQGTGIIFLKNERELLVLSDKKSIEDAESIRVTFQNGEMAEAQLKKYDGNTGIAVLAVALGNLSEELQNNVKVTELGNSYQVRPGTMVIAVGSPMGENGSIYLGTVTNSSGKVSTWDANYAVLNTDIVANGQENGVLINQEGQIVGLMLQEYGNGDGANATVTAWSVSELKGLIEDLANGGEVPYLGVKISTVTDQIAAENNLPVGVYVKDVHNDSPAMAAGVQSGDVIVKIGTEEVKTEKDFTEELIKYRPKQKISFTVMRMGADSQYREVPCQAELSKLD